MSDKEIIIRSLQKVERRIRANRLFKDLTLGLAVFLIIPLGFKIWDLFSPFTAIAVTTVISLWFVAFSGYFVWRLLQKGTLAQAAVSVDRQAALHDELKTAYWFINNPRPSEWVDLQIRRAARNAQSLDLDRLYPGAIPRTSYLAAGMLLLVIGLNFVPLPWNHNWLALQAAPAYALTDKEQALLEQTRELLLKAERLEQSELAQRLEEIMQQLQEGKISPLEAMQQLQEIRNLLEEGNLDVGSINDGLEEIAKDLEQSDELKDVAKAMLDKDLLEAAKQMRELAEKLQGTSPEAQKEMQQSLQEASENSRPGLEELSKDLQEAASGLQNQKQQSAQQSLKQAAEDLEDISQKMQSQQLKNEASQQLQNLAEAMRQRQQQGQQQAQQGQPQQARQGQPGQPQQQGEGQQSSDAAAENQQGQQGQQAAPAGEQQAGGLMPSGNPGGNAPREGPPTKLEVQLQQEKLTGQHDQGTVPENIEEASKQERSKLDYRNVRSDLSPAQKDLLNQDRIPWEYRPLIKNYFQAIRPRQK